MSVLVNADTKVICQGFTGNQGTFHSDVNNMLGVRIALDQHDHLQSSRFDPYAGVAL